jgi:hypothetical protein
MKKVYLLFLAVLCLLVLVVSCTQSQAPETSTLRIEVSRHGFNNEAGGPRFEVTKGQEIEIIFAYGDNDFSQNNPHIIAIPSLNISTGIFDENNPEETIRFTPGQTGEVRFMCTQGGCVGHTKLQGGIIVIQ